MDLSEQDLAIANVIREKLLAIKDAGCSARAGLTISEIDWLCTRCEAVLRSQPCLLELQAPMTVCGDTHGQYADVMRLLDLGGDPATTPYLFLGDYVDRGNQSIETVSLMFLFKILYPDTFFILRGNHECRYINRMYGFFDECKLMYKEEVWRQFCGVFQWLPIAAIISDKIFCVHGGISPALEDLDQIRNLQRPFEIPEDQGFLLDLVWSDPSAEVEEWDDNERGTSVCFGQAPVGDFLQRFGFDLICRAHQAVMGGYEFPFWPNQSLVTIFSAANYCYEYQNRGALLKVDQNLYCTFQVLEPIDWKAEELNLERPGTPPRAGLGEEVQFFTPV